MATHTFLPRPSLLRGVARVVDLFGGLGRGVRRVSTDDYEALTGDWRAVAGDMDAAFRETRDLVVGAARHGQAQG
ncbi:MAG TPA: hypothetical protein VFS20_16450 [Longimicrobium sp.]|nr:hypothetical protein [Longimicrobium sp.]